MNPKYIKAAVQITETEVAERLDQFAAALSKKLGFKVSRNQAVANLIMTAKIEGETTPSQPEKGQAE